MAQPQTRERDVRIGIDVGGTHTDAVILDGDDIVAFTKALTSAELTRLTRALALRTGRYFERLGLLKRDAENSYPTGDNLEAGPRRALR